MVNKVTSTTCQEVRSFSFENCKTSHVVLEDALATAGVTD